MSTARQLSFFDLFTRYDVFRQHGGPLECLPGVIPEETFGHTLVSRLKSHVNAHAEGPS